MNKALFFFIIALSLGVTELQAQNWSIFREYEFNSSPIDTNIWVNYYPTGHYWCNTMTWYQISRCHGTPISELATYWDNYVQYFNNGTKEGIKLIADVSPHLFENCVNYNFKSGMIYSKELFQYGKFEIKCKVPNGKGFWPAFWLWGQAREIDVFEFMNDPTPSGSNRTTNVAWFNYHRNSAPFTCGTSYTNDFSYSDDFHIFSVEWTDNHIKWYIDNELRWMIHSSAEYFPDVPMHIIANLAIQGYNWADYSPDSGTIFPNSIDIDYIKVYTENCPSFVLCESDILTTYSGFNIDLAIPNDIDYNGVVETSSCDFTCSKTVLTELTVTAENCITLNNGFSVELGAEFNANISTCSND